MVYCNTGKKSESGVTARTVIFAGHFGKSCQGCHGSIRCYLSDRVIIAICHIDVSGSINYYAIGIVKSGINACSVCITNLAIHTPC